MAPSEPSSDGLVHHQQLLADATVGIHQRDGEQQHQRLLLQLWSAGLLPELKVSSPVVAFQLRSTASWGVPAWGTSVGSDRDQTPGADHRQQPRRHGLHEVLCVAAVPSKRST